MVLNRKGANDTQRQGLGFVHPSIRLRTAASLVLIVPLGFWLRRLNLGPESRWIANWGGSLSYEVFWMLVVFLFVPRPQRITAIAVGVCAATYMLEFAQLWHPPPLQMIRSTFLGRAVLGTAFSWWDLPIYPVGCALGWLWLRGLCKWGDRAAGPPAH